MLYKLFYNDDDDDNVVNHISCNENYSEL